MAERIIMNEVKTFEWESMMSMTGNKLSKFNAIDQNLNCSQLMRNAGLDWTVSKVPVQATIDNETITSDKLCGGIFVAIPTAIPLAPLTKRFGTLVGITTGSLNESSKLS